MAIEPPYGEIPYESLVSQFDYDKELPLDLKQEEVGSLEGIITYDISFAVGLERRMNAYLVAPDCEGPRRGLIYVHPAPGDRGTFLDEALGMAPDCTVCLLVDAPWAHPETFAASLGNPESDRQTFIQIVKYLRRAVDVIASRPGVLPDRIGYIGHSSGGQFGGILAGIEKRIGAWVIMAATGRFADVAEVNIPSLKGESLEEYRRAMSPIDPIRYIGHAAPSPVLFQFGLRDTFFPREKFEEFAHTAGEPKEVRWYEADHYLDLRAHDDRTGWLCERLPVGR